jgi:Caspase domain/Ankyrin repeats (3 copies)
VNSRPTYSPSPRAAQSLLLAVLFLILVGSGPLGCIARSAARGDARAVKAYLDAGKNIESTDWKKRSPLELSIMLNRTEVMDLLIKEGANVNRRGKGSRTPLIWASMRRGSPEVIAKLIAAGADPNGTDKAGQTPLLYSILYGSLAQTRALIEGGADINHRMTPKWRTTVLSPAIRHKKFEAVEFLVASGADIEVTDSRGHTAREQAARRAGMLYAIDRGLEKYQASRATQLASAGAATRSSPMPTARATPSPVVTPKPAPVRIAAPVVAQPTYATPPTTPTIQVARVAPSRSATNAKGLRLGEYYALVIGNDDYDHLPKLQTAVNDARALSELLRDRYGYRVNTLLNASRSEILQALSQYRRILTSQDNLLIYYAGHGWLDEDADRGYWLPIDATQDDDVHWIANESITSKTRAIEAKHVMVIADSCYSGKLVRGIHVNQNTPNYLKRLATRRARVVLTSGGIEPVSDSGGRDNHSVFAAALLRALEENNDVLEGHELFTKVRRPVAVNSDQIPEYSDIRKAGHDGGDFLFILP